MRPHICAGWASGGSTAEREGLCLSALGCLRALLPLFHTLSVGTSSHMRPLRGSSPSLCALPRSVCESPLPLSVHSQVLEADGARLSKEIMKKAMK